MKNRYYGFQFTHGTKTTAGTPNEKTGRMNIAGIVFVFDKKESAEKWAAEGESRTVQTISELRKKCLGISVQEFHKILKYSNSYDGDWR